MSFTMQYRTLIALIFILVTGAGAAEPCPTSVEEWTKWRESILLGLSAPTDLNLKKIELLKLCRKQPEQAVFFNEPKFRACMAPMERIARAMNPRSTPYQSGFTLKDEEYYESKRLEYPAMFELPPVMRDPEFLKKLRSTWTRNSTLQKWIAKFQKTMPGFQALKYTSRVLPNQEAIAFLRPGDDFDQWFHFIVGIDEILVVSIQKRDGKHQLLDRPRVYYNEFHFIEDEKDTPFPVGKHDLYNSKLKFTDLASKSMHSKPMSCHQCHRTGAMPLVPVAGSKLITLNKGTDPVKQLAWFNDRVADTANAVSDSIDVQGFGPSLGEFNPKQRTDQFVVRCSGNPQLSKTSLVKIKKAMNCSSCHDGDLVGALDYPVLTDDSTAAGIRVAETFIKSGHMPPGENLSTEERDALFECLIYEYYGGFKAKRFNQNPNPGTFLRSLLAIPCV